MEEKFRKSVEHSLSLYDKYENYKQDLRMVKLWIKYIDFKPNKPNLYKILYQQGIGTKCAAFYIAWAHYYNSENSLKQAESIYTLGVQLKAEPLDDLLNAQKNFRYSIAQRMLYNDESSKKRTISCLAEQRQQITSLSPHPNSQPSQPNAKRPRTESASVEQSYAQQSDNFNKFGYAQTQYCNQQNYYQQQSDTSGYVSTNVTTNQYEYAEYSTSVQQPQESQPVAFTFNSGFQKPQNFINSARNSHEPWDGLLFLEEPFDPNRRCFYPKNNVYPGDGCEYSLEELMENKWKVKMEEKRKQEEQERIRREMEKQRLEADAQRLKEEQEAMRVRLEAERKKQEEEQRRYQMYQQQQQQWNAYHSPVSYGSPYYQQGYENSPQYLHDHQYQTQYYHQPQPAYSYQNSPSYHHQSVIVNRNQYEGQHNYYQSYAQPAQNYVENEYQYNQHIPATAPPSQSYEEPDYQDVEYLIDHQAEIDPNMLNQPIGGNEFSHEASENSSDSDESEEEQIPTIVNSYMLDDLEEQIEASTISFSSNGKSRDKKITIKFRKEKTVIANSESNSMSSLKVPLESTSTSSSSQSSSKKKKEKVTKELITSFDGENTQFMPSAANSNSSSHNGDQNFGKITFNGCVTPIRKPAASKSSTPISSYKFLKDKSSYLSYHDESFTNDQNSFFMTKMIMSRMFFDGIFSCHSQGHITKRERERERDKKNNFHTKISVGKINQ